MSDAVDMVQMVKELSRAIGRAVRKGGQNALSGSGG